MINSAVKQQQSKISAFLLILMFISFSFGQDTNSSNQTKESEANAIFAEAKVLVTQNTETSRREAIAKFEQALKIYEEIDHKKYQAYSLEWLADTSKLLGEKRKAIDSFNQALEIYKVIDDKKGEDRILQFIGRLYSDLGENQRALEFYNVALPLSRQLGNKSGEAVTLNNIGLIYSELGEMQKALEFYNKSLSLRRVIGDKSGEAVTLLNIGSVYDKLGDKQKALEFFNQSLPIFSQVGYKHAEAATLNNIGLVYNKLGDKQKALEFYNQALPLIRQVGDKSGEATTLTNIGVIYSDLGENQKALEFHNQALPLFREISNKSGEAGTLNNIGATHKELGEKRTAIKFYNQALLLHKAIGEKGNEAAELNNLMLIWESVKNPRLAILYGKQSVNLFQELRTNIQGLDKEIQKIYLKSVESTYRKLADILINQGRIAEAEQVLGMLKEDEYFSYLRRDKKVAAELKEQISLSPDEKKAFEDYEKYADEITATAQDFDVLKKKKNDLPLGETLSAEDQKRYDELEAKYNSAVTVFNKFLDDLKVRFAQKGEQFNQVAAIDSVTKQLLKKLDQPRTVIISTIVGEDRLNLIVTTAGIQKAHTVDISSNELNKLVVEFRDAVKNPSVDPRFLGKQLYDKLFPAELQKDLANIKADTIVWSLDGTLRYVPMAALWDGEKYLVERYNNAILTLAAIRNIEANADPNRQNWQVFGVGVSKPFEKFSALPAVPQELCSVVENPQKKELCKTYGKTGVFGGLMRLDEEFTKEDFTNNIGKKQVAIVHIASHFDLNAGDYKDSYLLLGGGKDRRFSLEDLRGKEDLGNIELLTLSACNTAMTSGANSSGVEVEGFGALAQKQGAKTVLATLWAVADDSTGELMTEFYRILEENPKIGKAEALQTAQIKMIGGEYKTKEEAAKKRSDLINLSSESANQPKFETDKKAPFAHPYFWSPFVLIGNWK